MLETNDEYPTLPERMRVIRLDLFGDDGAFLLASLLRIPEAKWRRMEASGRIPAHVILAFIEITGANPRWLLSGAGEKYSRSVSGDRAGGPGFQNRRPISFR
jgi:hypothetical protein